MEKLAVLLLVGCVSRVCSLPLQTDFQEAAPLLETSTGALNVRAHSLQRRFISPVISLGAPAATATALLANIRAKRSYDECEKLQLCKLHARSRQSFYAAYELYFVNKENARLWDHRARSMEECEQRFGGCYYS